MTDLAVSRTGTTAAPSAAIAARATRLRVTTDGLAMAGLAVLAGVLYLVNLTVSGYGNTYYSMAAQAASQSWSALFFGALDANGFITLDKPPLATALMGLSVRVFGLSSWSVLLPEALAGVGTVLVLFLAVRRSFGSRAALLAGGIMALTPVAVLIFRYDNPDALLTFLLVTAAWALGRGLERGAIRWAALAAFLVGLGFLTKYLQAWMVLPAFALVWLVAAPGSLRRRVAGLAVSAIAVAASSLWWVAIVELLPAASRPSIGGSVTNSALELLLGYDGLGRIFGNNPGGSGLSSGLDGRAFGGANAQGGPGGAFGGDPGVLRLFNDVFGGQIAWLLPAALLSIVAAVAIHRHTARTDRRVGGYLLWSAWLLVHVAVFSFMSGIIHPYYSVILVPAIAALVGAAAVELWDRRRTSQLAALALAAGVVVSGVTAWALLERTPGFLPGLGLGVLALSIAAAILVAIQGSLLGPAINRVAIALALVAVLAGPLAYAGVTMQTAYAGGDPGAGPQTASFGGGAAGPGDVRASTDTALIRYLVEHRGNARWIVTVDGANVAAPIQLAAGEPVMAMGGFTGSDPAPTLAALKAAIASGELRYVLVEQGGPGGGGPGVFGGPAGGGRGVTSERSAWVTSTCAAVRIDGASTSLYDCAGAG